MFKPYNYSANDIYDLYRITGCNDYIFILYERAFPKCKGCGKYKSRRFTKDTCQCDGEPEIYKSTCIQFPEFEMKDIFKNELNRGMFYHWDLMSKDPQGKPGDYRRCRINNIIAIFHNNELFVPSHYSNEQFHPIPLFDDFDI